MKTLMNNGHTKVPAERVVHFLCAMLGASNNEGNFVLRLSDYPDLPDSSWSMISHGDIVRLLRHDAMNVLRFSVNPPSLSQAKQMVLELGLDAADSAPAESGVRGPDTERSVYSHAVAE